MKSILTRIFRYSALHLPDVLALFLAIGFFLFLGNFFITEKSLVQRLVPTLVGFGGGLVGGGILGWIVGGIGVVAMGTGVGLGALGVVAVGSVAGAVIGGLTGTSISFLLFIRIPANFDVSWLGFFLACVGTAVAFFCFRYLTRRLAFANRFNANTDKTKQEL